MFKLQKNDVQMDILLLLLIGGLYSLGTFLSNTFVNVYLWRQSEDFLTIASYNLAIFIFQPLTFIIAGNLAKKIDRIIVLRLGVIFLALFFITVLIMGEQSATYNIILGSLLGIGYGFYWLAYNVLTFEITEPDTRDFFNGFLGSLESLGGMIGPIIAGLIISKMKGSHGYTTIFVISLALFVLAVIFSFFLKRRKAEGNYNLVQVYKEKNVNPDWRLVLNAHIFEGLRDGVFIFVIPIWVFVYTNSELALGVFNLILSSLSFLLFIVVTKFLKPHMRKKAILLGGIVTYFSIFLILFELNYVTLLIYAILIGISVPIIDVPYTSMTYDVIGVNRYAKQLRVEFIVMRELHVNIGRVLSVSLFIISITLFDVNKVMPYLLVIFGTGYLFITYIMGQVYKRNSKSI